MTLQVTDASESDVSPRTSPTRPATLRPMKVGVVGLYTNQNVGDYLLVECTKFLLKRISPDITLRSIDVDPREATTYRGRRKLNLKIFEALRRNKNKAHAVLRSQYLRYWYDYFTWWVKVNWHYRREIQGLDCLIVAGGGFIKFRTQGLNYLDEQILKIAHKKKIPVMFNAVGVEGYDPGDVRCRRLKAALNLGEVRAITTRDDLETLRKGYIETSAISSGVVGDPVLWLRDMLAEEKPESLPTGRIGINLVNPNNYTAYGGSASALRVENFFKNLIQELTIADADFYLFTNGMAVDYKFGSRLLAKMNVPKDRLIRRPADSSELIETVCGFDIILAARMHAGIVAYALDVPMIGLIWSEKIEFFSQQIGERDRYYDETELDAAEIAGRLVRNEETPPDESIRSDLKASTIAALAEFIDSVARESSPA